MDVGLDVKRSRMEEARGLNIYKKLVYYDGKNIPFKGRLFQTIVSNCVLEHVTELDALLLEIYKIVKPKGRVYLTVMAKPWENNLFGSLFLGNSYASFMKKKQQHVNLFSYIQWKQSFQRAGFTVKKCIGYLSPHACRFIDIAHYVSIPNLVSYMLFTRWVLFPKFVGLYPIDRLSRLIASDVDPLKVGALFFVLQKPLGKKIASQGQALRS